VLTGRAAAPGQVLGPLAVLATMGGIDRIAGGPQEERAALEAAIAGAIVEIDKLAARNGGVGEEMLEFQSAILADDSLSEPALAAIAAGRPADEAWIAALNNQIAEYQSANDDTFRTRASDFVDLRDRVLRRLLGAAPAVTIPHGAVIVANDLTPTQFLEADWSQGGGIALAGGSPSSHVAMLARSRGVPMVVGLGQIPVDSHATALIDGSNGQVVLSPGAGAHASYVRAMTAARSAVAQESAALCRPVVTRDGVAIAVSVNISGPRDLASIEPASCDGVGLFRTELMFRSGEPLPDEEAQYQAYCQCLDWAGEHPVTIRTLDIGGDKPIRGLTPVGESNPFLGSRGIRLTLARPDIFRVQLRALARAATQGNLKVMLPMVTLPSELDDASRLLDSVIVELTSEGKLCRRPPMGIMIEVPAAALTVTRFARAAFFSIGSNDLTQYVMAASRDTPAVAGLNEGAPEAVLQLMAGTVTGGGKLGIEVSLCGDIASDIRLLPQLLAIGLRSFSVAPAALGRVKTALTSLSIGGDDGQN